MTGLLDNLALGFGVVFGWSNLFYAFIGCLFGTLIGVLPGLGPLATIAMLIPVTFGLDPITALIMLAGIYYGAQYGGSTTAILVNLPGESSSVVTCLDGYQMARQGRAGAALAIAAIGSFVAGCVGTLVIALFGPALGEMALSFGAPENFSLMVLGLVMAVTLANGSVLRACGMILLGILFGLVGTDINWGRERFTLGIDELSERIDLVGVALGMFGIADIIANLERREVRDVFTRAVGRLLPSRADMRASIGPILRGTGLGAIFGLLPGSHTTIASFSSYALEKRLTEDPDRFGKGAIEGVAGPEAANNAAAQTYFIPMLTLGLPTGGVMALMMGAMMIHGIAPGPQIMTTKPELFWGLICSMWVGNLMLVVLNLPMIGIWTRLLAVPYRLLFPAILLLSCIGTYSISNSSIDVYVAAFFGLLGYVLIKLGCEPAPFLLGFVLGPMMEENLRRTLLLSDGSPLVFVTRPISAGMLAAAVLAVVFLLLPAVRRRKQTVLN